MSSVISRYHLSARAHLILLLSMPSPVADVTVNRKLAVVDHVQLPKIHKYHEVDRSQRYLESKGNIQKMSGFTRDANELIATSKVSTRTKLHARAKNHDKPAPRFGEARAYLHASVYAAHCSQYLHELSCRLTICGTRLLDGC